MMLNNQNERTQQDRAWRQMQRWFAEGVICKLLPMRQPHASAATVFADTGAAQEDTSLSSAMLSDL